MINYHIGDFPEDNPPAEITINAITYRRYDNPDERLLPNSVPRGHVMLIRDYLKRLLSHKPTSRQLMIFARMAQNEYERNRGRKPWQILDTQRGRINVYRIDDGDLKILDAAYSRAKTKGLFK